MTCVLVVVVKNARSSCGHSAPRAGVRASARRQGFRVARRHLYDARARPAARTRKKRMTMEHMAIIEMMEPGSVASDKSLRRTRR
jgi:hypothetical protein